MALSPKHHALAAWFGSQIGCTAWLVRLVHAWFQADEPLLAWATIAILVFANLAGYILYRQQKRLSPANAMTLFLVLLAALTASLLTVATSLHKLDTLSTNIFAPSQSLWLAPIFYLLAAVIFFAISRTSTPNNPKQNTTDQATSI